MDMNVTCLIVLVEKANGSKRKRKQQIWWTFTRRDGEVFIFEVIIPANVVCQHYKM